MNYLKSFKEKELENIIKLYIGKTNYDILSDWGNCFFYTKDFIQNIGGEIVYLPISKDYINGENQEDHVIPLYKGTLIDFAYVPTKGVSKDFRIGELPNFNPGYGDLNWPRLSKIEDKSLFKKDGLYGKLGYLENSKYADWEYDYYPELENGVYPIVMRELPDYGTIEEPRKKS